MGTARYRDHLNDEYGDYESEEVYGDEEEEENETMMLELANPNTTRRVGVRGLSSLSNGRAHGGANNSGSSSSFSIRCKFLTGLFLIALVGVYQLGLQEGRNEVIVGVGNDGSIDAIVQKKETPWHEKVVNAAVDAMSNTLKKQPTTTTTTDKSSGSFTIEKLKATRVEANKIITMLDEYYSGKDVATRMLIHSWMDPWDFSTISTTNDNANDSNIDNDDTASNQTTSTTNTEEDNVKYLRSAKLVDTMARALITDEQTSFLMGGIGSSVMAGHDNCHYDSYQTQMERLWSPVWSAAGMEFIFTNAGEGGGCGDSHENQHFCVTQNISPNVDIVHYSWTYFEGGKAAWVHENLIRWTQMLPKQPIVHIFNTGSLPPPALSSSGGARNKASQYGQLTNYYAQYGYNHFYMRSGLENGGYDYASERDREIDPIDRFGWGYVGDGYHNTTRYGVLEDNDARKETLGVVMRNWHPGPLGFQLTSDAFTYVYTHALLKALDLIEQDMNDGNDPRDTWSATERPLLLKGDLPEPQFCDPEYCVVDEPPGCLNYELPTFGNWGARVESPDDDLNPYINENQNWNVWHETKDFWKMVDKADIAIFKDRDDKKICQHLDFCGGISAQNADDGMVVFRLPKMEVGLVVICGCCGKNVGESMFLNNQDIEISYNTVSMNSSEWEIWPNPKCVRILKRFPTSGRASENPTGHAYLAVKVLRDMSQPIRISHVITL
jgi:hypothetical protein